MRHSRIDCIQSTQTLVCLGVLYPILDPAAAMADDNDCVWRLEAFLLKPDDFAAGFISRHLLIFGRRNMMHFEGIWPKKV